MKEIWKKLVVACLLAACTPSLAQNTSSARTLAEWPVADLDQHVIEQSCVFNSLRISQIREGDLTMTVTGPDPYIVGPPVEFRAHGGRRVLVKLTAASGHDGTVYFTTKDSPAFSEKRRVSFALKKDDGPREYVIDPTTHPEWTGTITRLRLDIDGAEPGSTVRLHEFRVEQPVPEIRIDSFHTDRALVKPGENLGISARITNVGGTDIDNLRTDLSVPEPVSIVEDDSRTDMGVLRVGESQPVKWTVKVPADGVHVLALTAQGRPDVSATRRLNVAPSPALPDFAPPLDKLQVEWSDDGDIYFSNKTLCLYVKRGRRKYGPAGLYLRNADSETSTQVAVMPYLARLELDEGGPIDIYPVESRLHHGLYEDEPFVQATFISRFDFGTVEISFSANKKDPWIAATYVLTASRALSVRHFSGPTVLAGEGEFGGAKRAAVFPGLEYLVAGEKSSSDTDMSSDYIRFVPDSDKITAPYMAVRQKDKVVQVMWPLPGTVGAGWTPLSAVFASPNWLHDQQNHLMELFAPGGRRFVSENEMSAFKPIDMMSGDQLAVSAKLATYKATGKGLAEAARVWCDAYGVPAPPPPPRITEDSVKLSARAYTDACWDDENRGWRANLRRNESARFIPSAVVSLMMAAHTTDDRDLAEKYRATVRRSLKNRPPAVYGPALAWRIGGIRKNLAALENAAKRAIKDQQPNGSWTYPGDDHEPPLGVKGGTAPGICAERLQKILTYAGITGDPAATAAAVRGLDAMKRFTVPRGGQLWEIPLHTPDIRAAGMAGMVFLRGYKLTGDPQYLDEARYWADTGLPFVYFQRDPARPVLAFATIPVFGATFYKSPNWIGRPVQWCGLDYARLPAELSDLEYDKLYDNVARGILNSALHQQIDTGPNAGTYPDFWLLDSNRGGGPLISPGLIMSLMYTLQGYATELQWAVCRAGRTELHISSAARIIEPVLNDGEFTSDLRYPAGGESFTVVKGVGHVPDTVMWDDTPLSRSPSQEPDLGQWSYDPSDDLIIVRCRFQQHTHRLRVVL